MSSLNKVRLPDGTQLNISEWLHWPLYSAVEIGNGDTVQLDAFSYVVGDNVPQTSSLTARQATELDTNLTRKRKMNQDEAFVCFAITYEAFGLTSTDDGASPPNPAATLPLVDANDLRRLQRALQVELFVGAGIKKPQVGVPFSWIGQGIGTKQWVSGSASAIRTASGGCPVPRNQRKLNLPVYIGGYGESARPGNAMTFALRCRSTSAIDDTVQDIRLRWWLDGLRKRPA